MHLFTQRTAAANNTETRPYWSHSAVRTLQIFKGPPPPPAPPACTKFFCLAASCEQVKETRNSHLTEDDLLRKSAMIGFTGFCARAPMYHPVAPSARSHSLRCKAPDFNLPTHCRGGWGGVFAPPHDRSMKTPARVCVWGCFMYVNVCTREQYSTYCLLFVHRTYSWCSEQP